ncbi:MAG: hypothetical protein N2258_07950, partial [Brevinematales bacterium]|nr:hypothetical protein [Brevinematales bacterium]
MRERFRFVFLMFLLAGCNTEPQKVNSSVSSSSVLPNISIACGERFTLILENGILWATGDNFYGQLGMLTNTTSLSPFMAVLSNVKAIGAGYMSSFAIKNDGTLWATGANNTGQLGTGNYSNTNQFVFVLSNVEKVI